MVGVREASERFWMHLVESDCGMISEGSSRKAVRLYLMTSGHFGSLTHS